MTGFTRWKKAKIFSFNLAGSLPEGILVPPAHINHAKLQWTQEGGEEDSDVDKMAASVHLQTSRSGST